MQLTSALQLFGAAPSTIASLRGCAEPELSLHTRRTHGYWRTLLALLLIIATGLLQAQPLLLTELPAGSLGTRADLLVEDGRPLSLEEARARQREGLFRKGSQPVLTSGIGSRPLWVHLELFNPTAESLPFRLVTGTTWVDRLSVFIVHDNQVSARWQTGDEYPNAQGLTAGTGFTFAASFAPGRSELYMRVDMIDPLVLPIELMTDAQAVSNERLVHYSYGLTYGFLLALIAYNSMLFAGLRERNYLYYSLYLASFILTNIAYTGHGVAWLWPEHPLLQRYAILVLMVLYSCCGLLFASRFLALAEHAPRALRLVRLSALLTAGMLALCIAMGNQLGAALLAFSFVSLFTLGMVLLGILTIRHGRAAGRYFLMATFFGMLGAFSTSLAVWGWLPFNSLTYHGVEYGIVIEATLLALALAHRFNEMDAKLSCVTVSRDVLSAEVAERRRVEDMLRKSEESLKESQAIAGLGSYVLDIPTGLFETSDVLDQLFGLDETYERSVKSWAARIHAGDCAMMLDYLNNDVLGQGKAFDKEYRIIRFNDQAERWVHGLGKLELDAQGRPLKLFGTVQDITERKLTEARLLNSLRQLEEKELAKTRFLAAAGHDLRQPVAAANLFVDALKDTSPTQHQSELIERLDQSMHVFSDLLERLLDISKFDAGLIKAQFASFNLVDLFNWLEQNFSRTAHDKQLRFRLFFPASKSLIVRTDIGLLQSVLMNLISNAIKFTERGSVLISARLRGDNVLLQVWDTGTGIAEADISHIFDEFYQVANPQRSREAGLGLGLSICQRAMSLLGSEVTCRSRPGHGSVFELSLPLNGAMHEIEPLPISGTPAEAADETLFMGKHVVVVEDDALVAAGMVNLLQGLGADVQHFPNAEEALRHDEIINADFFIVDYSLGGKLSGLEFLQELQHKQHKPIRAVIVTGETSSQFISGVSDSPWPVLHKPVNYAKLASSLSN